MDLLQIASDRYTVLAVCEPGGECQVLEKLGEALDDYPHLFFEMMALIQGYVPSYGPPFDNERQAKRLRNGICEFKARYERIIGLRVLFFEEENQLVICTHAFYKAGKTPPDAIPTAERIRSEYWVAKRAGDLRVRNL